MPAVTQLARRGLQCGFFPGARGTWSLPSFPCENDGAGSAPLPYLRPITIIVDCIHNILMRENQDEISSPVRFFPSFCGKLCREIQRCPRAETSGKEEHTPDAYLRDGPAPAGDPKGSGNLPPQEDPVLSGWKPSFQRELEEFPFFPLFSLTAPNGHHILYP